MFGNARCHGHITSTCLFLWQLVWIILIIAMSVLSLQLQMERKFLGEHLELVQNARANLPRFIEYMKLRTN